ncbi:MAG: hypothetical protein R3322_05980 [Kiloniellales bacterium]|jgi:hypothetical protein|nr:hypothetical protein [Kiloniellales bacterium]
MKALNLAIAALTIWAGIGCTFSEPTGPSAPAGGALPPPADLETPDATSAPAAPSAGDAPAPGTVIETIEPSPSAATEPSAVPIPEASGWINPSVPLSDQQADIDACFSYAQGQIERETQIDQDRYLATDEPGFQNQYGVNTFKQRVDYYSERRRRGALFDACMESKGYVKE